jgi:hypothetical protein
LGVVGNTQGRDQVIQRQLLPLQVFVQAPTQLWLQLPPAHVSVQLEEPLHDCRQLPPEQAKLHVPPDPHDWVQLPPAQSFVQLVLAGQAWVQLPCGHSPLAAPGVSTVFTEQPARARNDAKKKILDVIGGSICRGRARPHRSTIAEMPLLRASSTSLAARFPASRVTRLR